MGRESEHIERQKAFERIAFNPIKEILGITEVDTTKESPDVRFKYEGKEIGIEIIDCYPKAFDQRKQGAIRDLKKHITRVLRSKGIYGLHSVNLKECLNNIQRISDVRDTIVNEIIGLTCGKVDSKQCQYVSNAKRLVYTQSKEIFVQVSIEGMYLVKTPPIEDILSCIIKKNALYTTYDSTLDEIWLLIYLPTNENQYSIKGVPKLSKVETHFKRIYISDWQQNGKLIYEYQ